jgi:hypothetical protein
MRSVLDYGGEAGILSPVASHREDKTLIREKVGESERTK